MDNQIHRPSNNSTNTRNNDITRTRRTVPVSGQMRQTEYSEEEYDEQDEQSPNEAPQEVRYRIGSVAALLLIAAAGFFDVLELVLDLIGSAGFGIGVVIGLIKDAVSFVFFPAMFFILGAPIWKGRKAKQKMITTVSAFIVGLIPWVGAFLPETVIATLVNIYMSRSEDKAKAKGSADIRPETITRSKRI